VRFLPGVLLLSLASAAPTTASMKHWHEDKTHRAQHWQDRDDDEQDDRDRHEAYCYFEPHDLRIIREYYEPRFRSLPPGIAKKFDRTGHLPPGWQKKVEPLPAAVERRLVPLRPDYRRGYVDGIVVVYIPRTQIVLDVAPLFPE